MVVEAVDTEEEEEADTPEEATAAEEVIFISCTASPYRTGNQHGS